MEVIFNLTTVPEQSDFYQSLINRVTNNEFTGLCEFIQANWEQLGSSAVIPLDELEQHNISYNYIFWYNMQQIWVVLKSHDKNINLVSFASEIEKVAENPENLAKHLHWNLISAVSLKSADDVEAAKSKANDAALILTNSVNIANSKNTTWRDIGSDAILMIEQLYQWNEVDFNKHFITSILENLETSQNVHEAFSTIWQIGTTLLKFSEPLAITCFELCERLSRKSQNYELLVSALTNLGAAVNDIGGDKQKGLEISLEAVAIADAHGCTNNIHAIFDVGNILLNLGRASEAEPYLRSAIELGKRRNQYSEVVHALRALARQFYWRGLAPEAKDLYEEAVAIGVRENELEAAHRALAEYADLMRETGEYENAKKAYLDARILAEQVGDMYLVKDYLQSAETMNKAIDGEVVFYQFIEDSKWKLKWLPRKGFENLVEKDSDSLIPYWTLNWAADTNDKFDQEKSNIEEAIKDAIQNQDTNLEAENRISLTWVIFEYVVIRRFSYQSEVELSLLIENNKSLLALEGLLDDKLQAGILLSLAVESVFQRSLEGRIYESQIVYSTLNLELGKGDTLPKANHVSAIQMDDESIILEIIRLSSDLPNDDIRIRLVNLVGLLPRSETLNILKKCLLSEKTRRWGLEFAYILEKIASPQEILPIFENFEADQSLNNTDRANLFETIGSLKIQLGSVQEGEECLLQALTLSREIDDKKIQAVVLDSLGMAYRQIGQYDKALQFYDLGIATARSISLQTRLAALLHHKGNLLFDQMNFPEARNCFYLALDEYLKLPDYVNMSYIFDNLANIAAQEGSQKKEIWYRRRALDLATWSHQIDSVALCSYHLGVSYMKGDEFEKSFQLLTQSSELYSSLGRNDRVVFLGNAIGQWYANRLNPHYSEAQAIEAYEKVLNLAKNLGVISQQITSLSSLSRLYLIEDFDRATDYLNDAIDLCRKIPQYDNLVDLLQQKADYHVYKREWSEALKTILEALEVLEIVKLQYSTRADYQNFIAKDYVQLCESCAFYAFMSNKTEYAFYLVEQSKSYNMRDQLAKRWKTNAPEDVPPEWLERESEILKAVNNINEGGQFATGDHALKRDEENRNLNLELHRIWEQIGKIAPQYVMAKKGATLDVQNVEEYMSRIEFSPYLIEFLFTPQWDVMSVMIIHPGQEYLVKPVIIKKESFERALHNALIEVEEYPLRGNIGETWFEVFNELAAIIDEYVPEEAPIILVPHGFMHHLPLHAIPVNGKRLIERNPVSYLPSASILQFSQKKSEIKSSLVVGSVFEEEAYKIADLLGAQSLIGKDARESRVRELLSNPNIIHFSCHGIFDPKYPLLSGLALSGDDVLTADAILQMQLNASLVVLSACQTGQSRILQGDELQGLTQAFMIAGAQTVVSTLWSVEDRSTTEFMTSYYQKILDNNQSYIKALQQTQVQMIQSGKWSHPFYWAAFIANSIQ